MSPTRILLPHRRPAVTQALRAGDLTLVVTVGFSPTTGQPQEVFAASGKEGSLLNGMLADTATAISIALQHGVTAEAMAKSMGRVPVGPVEPADLDKVPKHLVAASPIGNVLDLLCQSEREAEPLAECEANSEETVL